jgi:hypothetical protein
VQANFYIGLDVHTDLCSQCCSALFSVNCAGTTSRLLRGNDVFSLAWDDFTVVTRGTSPPRKSTENTRK